MPGNNHLKVDEEVKYIIEEDPSKMTLTEIAEKINKLFLAAVIRNKELEKERLELNKEHEQEKQALNNELEKEKQALEKQTKSLEQSTTKTSVIIAIVILGSILVALGISLGVLFFPPGWPLATTSIFTALGTGLAAGVIYGIGTTGVAIWSVVVVKASKHIVSMFTIGFAIYNEAVVKAAKYIFRTVTTAFNTVKGLIAPYTTNRFDALRRDASRLLIMSNSLREEAKNLFEEVDIKKANTDEKHLNTMNILEILEKAQQNILGNSGNSRTAKVDQSDSQAVTDSTLMLSKDSKSDASQQNFAGTNHGLFIANKEYNGMPLKDEQESIVSKSSSKTLGMGSNSDG